MLNPARIGTPALVNAIAEGFNCANCNRRMIGFTPIRRSNDGPFFCSFLCGFDFAAQNGDDRATQIAQIIRNAGRR